MIPFFTVLPLGGAFILALIGKYSKRGATIISCAISGILCCLAALLLVMKTPGSISVYHVGGWLPAQGGILLVVDGFTRYMLVIVNFVALMVNIFSIHYMERFTVKYKFHTLFLLLVAGMNGVVISGDIFNLFVFFEVASMASYALVAFGVEARELEASFKYTIMGVLASLFILLAIALLYAYTSTLTFSGIAQALAVKGATKPVAFIGILLMIGFGLKGAVVPFHGWLPDAHPAAPAPVSAMLSGVFIKTLGIYAICRVFFTIFTHNATFLNVIMILGVVSIITGGLLALGQKDIKRMLAYSSISQVGYIMLGLGLNTGLGIVGALFHLFNHSLFKSLLFLNAGALEYATGTRDLDQLGGLKTKMPTTAFTSMIASMSISGIPPFNGFFSKLVIIMACLESNHLGMAVWAIVGSVLTLAYFTKFQKETFFGPEKAAHAQVKEVPASMKVAMLGLSLACVIAGLLLLPACKDYFLTPAKNVLTERSTMSHGQ